MNRLDDLVLLANPAAGNEPFLLAVAVARKVNEHLGLRGLKRAKIVVPAANQNVKRILGDEYGADLGEPNKNIRLLIGLFCCPVATF